MSNSPNSSSNRASRAARYTSDYGSIGSSPADVPADPSVHPTGQQLGPSLISSERVVGCFHPNSVGWLAHVTADTDRRVVVACLLANITSVVQRSGLQPGEKASYAQLSIQCAQALCCPIPMAVRVHEGPQYTNWISSRDEVLGIIAGSVASLSFAQVFYLLLVEMKSYPNALGRIGRALVGGVFSSSSPLDSQLECASLISGMTNLALRDKFLQSFTFSVLPRGKTEN